MKKSKVIVPAMALLLFSTAASITGTVAWFTSNRVFNTSAGDFTARSIDGNLDVTLGAGVGTHVDTSTNPDSIAVNTGAYLIDGSVDVEHQTAYRLSRTPSAANYYTPFGLSTATKTGTTDVPTWLYREEGTGDNKKSYYVAMSWTFTFNYTFNTETKDVGIYLDLNQCAFVPKKVTGDTDLSGETDKDIAKGFRIGFKSDNYWRVWGNNDDTVTNLTYVSGEAQGATTAYAATNYFTAPQSLALVGDGVETSSSTRLDRIATITAATATNGTGSAVVTCFAWFEGTDPNVVSDTEFNTLSANMYFYARSDR